MNSSFLGRCAAATLAVACVLGSGCARADDPVPAVAPAVAAPVSFPVSPPPLTVGEIELIVNALDGAPDQGFEPGEFDPAPARALLASDDPADREKGEALLRAQVVAYASAQHGGRLAVASFPRQWAIRPAPYAAAAELDAALAEDRLATWLASLAPSHARYARLVEAYARYRAIAAAGGWPQVPAGKPLKPGDVDPRVEILRNRLKVEDPTVEIPEFGHPAVESPVDRQIAGPPPGADVYDEALKAAVARAQDRYGLNAEGVIGPSTVAALNVSAETRVQQIALNLERWRWAPRALAPERVELNIPAAWLDAYEAGRPVLSMRAVVGRPRDRTPSFIDEIDAVVFFPPWNVPPTIAANEVWPKIRGRPGYMARERYVVRPNGGLQQLPGPKSALGLVKFDMSNPFGVYLHDTPSKSLFAREARYFSHGCMRLQKPYDLAKWALRTDPAWPAQTVDRELAGPVATLRTPLARPISVYVLYVTASVDEAGEVSFFSDPYGWDAKLAAMLGDAR